MSNLESSNELKNDNLNIKFESGLIKEIILNNKNFKFNTKIINYSTKNSGIYTFNPLSDPEKIGELTSFITYSGDLTQLAVSKFVFRDQNIIQTIELGNNSTNFKISFKLSAPKDSDIFLHFSKPASESQYFYTFNTANIMKRSFEYPTPGRKGHNYYPINGALFIDLESEFFYVIPSFPLSAGMANQESFELNLHRHPSVDDNLGIGHYVPDTFPVEHQWEVGFHEPKYEFIWRKYLEHKNQPLILYLAERSSGLTENLKEAEVVEGYWTRLTDFGILFDDPCAHFVSLALDRGQYLGHVLNICDKSIDSPFNVTENLFATGRKMTGKMREWMQIGI